MACLLAAALLSGCSSSGGGVGTLIVDPGHYSVYHCDGLANRLKVVQAREQDLSNLMQRASEGGGGALIGNLSYRADYENMLGEEAVLRRVAAEKKCDLPPPPQAGAVDARRLQRHAPGAPRRRRPTDPSSKAIKAFADDRCADERKGDGPASIPIKSRAVLTAADQQRDDRAGRRENDEHRGADDRGAAAGERRGINRLENIVG